MKVDDLPPREYWATAQEDVGLATALQYAEWQGRQRADREAKKEREEERKKTEREQEAKRREKAFRERMKGR